ncbi:hypothetical protein SISSUDRAFT_198591 [Sistotremastrum suecicum HHB10207 ss-3]|uniref:Uncharacterized protein n=1 Tax=Sistotremastrum suecicum HHB10207 ss-3 TaxID=1314776 RepID=A0A166AA20_9AGAM|nr:hypothetical protein SISSUDRAFT_198591 [Sistotremastrum suecicum HHB10207 ss-3]
MSDSVATQPSTYGPHVEIKGRDVEVVFPAEKIFPSVLCYNGDIAQELSTDHISADASICQSDESVTCEASLDCDQLVVILTHKIVITASTQRCVVKRTGTGKWGPHPLATGYKRGYSTSTSTPGVPNLAYPVTPDQNGDKNGYEQDDSSSHTGTGGTTYPTTPSSGTRGPLGSEYGTDYSGTTETGTTTYPNTPSVKPSAAGYETSYSGSETQAGYTTSVTGTSGGAKSGDTGTGATYTITETQRKTTYSSSSTTDTPKTEPGAGYSVAGTGTPSVSYPKPNPKQPKTSTPKGY